MLNQQLIDSNKETIIMELRKIHRADIGNVINFLLNSDFFTAPASTKYHNSYDGGLAEHSLNAWYILGEKNKFYSLGLSDENIAITGLLHDVCKVDFYKKGIKNVKKGMKDNGYGKQVANWVEEEVWECEDSFPLGHGEKSVIRLMKLMPLEDIEIAMIRWHMGGYEPKENYRDLGNAVDKYPQIIAMHSADLEASHLTNINLEDKKHD